MRADRASEQCADDSDSPTDSSCVVSVDVCVTADRCVVLKVGGEVDVQSAGLLRSALLESLEIAERAVVDLRHVSFMDSTGLNALATVYRSRGPEAIVLRSPSSTVVQLLNIAGLGDVFSIEPAGDLSPGAAATPRGQGTC